MTNMRNLIILALFIIAGISLFFFGRVNPSAPSIPRSNVHDQVVEIGKVAPDFELESFDGTTRRLSDYRGKAVILDFWAAWCPFCVDEIPDLQKTQDEYQDSLVMIGIHRTDTESKEIGIEFFDRLSGKYLVLMDKSGELYKAYARPQGMPVAAFIDKEGVVQDIKVGPKTLEEIKQKVKSLLD